MKNQMIPGVILQNAIMAALRSKGLHLRTFATKSKINEGQVRYAIFGVSMGKRAEFVRQNIVDYAGRDLVEQIYKSRMIEEADKLRKEAA